MFTMPYPSKISRDSVVGAALVLLRRDGRAALGMRAVADALGVRPASLYKHVGDLAGLRALLAEAAALAMARELDAANAATSDAADGLRAVAAAYVAFAREDPHLYALLAEAGVPAEPGAERKALWNRLLRVVGALTRDPDDTAAAVALWAFLHGFVALEQAGMYGASGPRDGLARGLDALARGLTR